MGGGIEIGGGEWGGKGVGGVVFCGDDNEWV